MTFFDIFITISTRCIYTMNVVKRFNLWRQKFWDRDLEYQIYWMSLVIILFLAGAYGLVYIGSNYFGLNGLTQCTFKRLYGIPCPGCGGTRAVISLLHGDLIEAVYYHPFAVYTVIVYAVFFVSHTLRFITKGRISGFRYRDAYIIIAVVILVVQYVLKLFVPGYNV